MTDKDEDQVERETENRRKGIQRAVKTMMKEKAIKEERHKKVVRNILEKMRAKAGMEEETVNEAGAPVPAVVQAAMKRRAGDITTAQQLAREPKAPPTLINPRGATPVGPKPEPKAIPGGTAAGTAARLGDVPGAARAAAAAPNPMASMAAGRAAERSLKPKPPKAPGAPGAGAVPPPKPKPRFSGGGEHGAIPPGLGATFIKRGINGPLQQIPGGAKLNVGKPLGPKGKMNEAEGTDPLKPSTPAQRSGGKNFAYTGGTGAMRKKGVNPHDLGGK